jgi:hypothetical protein
MTEAGVFVEDDRVELLEGEIIEMPVIAKNPIRLFFGSIILRG